MTLLIPLILLVAAIYMAVALKHGSVALTVLGFLTATICFPAEFFSIDLAGLTITLDRLLLLPLCLQLALNWYSGEQSIRRFEIVDIAIGLFALWLAARTFSQPLGSQIAGQPNTLMHFLNGYFIPFFLYFAVRTSKIEPSQMRVVLYAVLGLGLYLSVTAVLEIIQMWSLVFPRFISDPTLGIHFGRARGPMLQSVRLGVVLIVCWLALGLFTVWIKPASHRMWLAFGVGSLLSCGAIYLTYTRSVWMGLAFCMLLLAFLGLQGVSRRFAITTMLLAACVVGIFKGPDLIAFKREYSAAETKESTYMRAAFAYVSLEMFQDKPISGFGFNQFQVYNPPYLEDRQSNLNLNSIRGYVHHNGFLSLLVDLGIVGLLAYLMILLSVVSKATSLLNLPPRYSWVHGIALLTLAFIGTHSIQMLFHEMSFSTVENGFLFAIIGLLIAADSSMNEESRQSPTK
ncbi:MAG: O-antigen ligase family protein [Planctomycetota bacterium]